MMFTFSPKTTMSDGMAPSYAHRKNPVASTGQETEIPRDTNTIPIPKKKRIYSNSKIKYRPTRLHNLYAFFQIDPRTQEKGSAPFPTHIIETPVDSGAIKSASTITPLTVMKSPSEQLGC